MVDVVKLLRDYEIGRLTRQGLLLRVCQAAAEQSLTHLAAELPAPVLAEIREWSASPPDSPDGCRVFGSVGAGPEFDAEAHFRKQSRQLHDGLWRWHDYFVAAEQGATHTEP